MTSHLRSPIHFDASGRTAAADRDTYVRGLIEQVLLTSPGERVRRPTFGAGLLHAVFAPGGDDLAAAAQDLVQASLHEWLGDIIDVEAVEVRSDDAAVRVVVRYTVRGVGERRVDAFTLPGGVG
jgi:phage baseplate assembly protein W